MTASSPTNAPADLVHLGTSSWTFPDWRGVFYPDGLPNAQMLNYYATQFNSIEVNTSFYALPEPSTLLQWVESVPDGFTFALKAPRLITHDKRLIDCQTETLAYLDVLRSLGRMAAPGLLQFPPNFRRAREGKVLADYLDWVAGQLEGIELAVEVRAADLMTAAFARFLAERGMTLVVVERTGSPDLYEIWHEQLSLSQTPRYLFLRLIGNDREKLPNDREIQRPQDELVARWATRIAGLLRADVRVYAYVHNPFEGHSPASVRRLWQGIHQQAPLEAWSPPLILPEDKADAGQLTLF